MIDPCDYIDPDEGREFVCEAFYAYGEPCENCGAVVHGQRVHVPGFDFLGCDDCAEEAKLVIFAEENCPVLHDAILRASNVGQVRKAMKEHEASCVNCVPALRKRAEVAEMPVRADRKEAA